MNQVFYPNPSYLGMPNNEMITNNYRNSNAIPITNTKIMSLYEMLQNNCNKHVTVYLSFPSSVDWRDVKISGVIEDACQEYIIIREPKTGIWKIILNKYINYIETEEKPKIDI